MKHISAILVAAALSPVVKGYAPQSEGAIAWNDPALKIDWRIPTEKVILSVKLAELTILDIYYIA